MAGVSANHCGVCSFVSVPLKKRPRQRPRLDGRFMATCSPSLKELSMRLQLCVGSSWCALKVCRWRASANHALLWLENSMEVGALVPPISPRACRVSPPKEWLYEEDVPLCVVCPKEFNSGVYRLVLPLNYLVFFLLLSSHCGVTSWLQYKFILLIKEVFLVIRFSTCYNV